MKLSHEFSVERKRHCYQGPVLDQQRFILGEGWLRMGGPCLGERILFQDRTPEGWIILSVLPL